MVNMTDFICPICKNKLIGEKTLKCENNHCFDRARSGYVNLLSGKGGNHGDPKEMVAARKNFLDRGYYMPLAKALAASAAECTPACGKVLDCGCGECYYTEAVAAALPKAGMLGIDVSKDAVAMGAKRLPEAELAVASVYAIPVDDHSIDTVLSVFAPAALEEFKRVLTPAGHLVMVIGGRDHLWSLKKAVYETPYKNEVADYDIDGFSLTDRKELKYNIRLEGTEDIKNLFAMTPYYHKTSPKDIAKLEDLTSLDTEIEFEILVYRRS